MRTWIWVPTPPTIGRRQLLKGGFPLSRYFYVRMHLNGTRISKIGAVYELSRVNVNLGEVPLSTFTRNLPYIASDLCMYLRT